MTSHMPILISGARAPVALHLTRLLSEAGHAVTLVDTVNHPVAAASRYCTGYHKLPSFVTDPDAARSALAGIISAAGIKLVIPTCEEVLHLSAMWGQHQMKARLFAPDIGLLTQVHNKFRFIGLCRAIGLPTPETTLIRNDAERDAFASRARDHVFKPVWSRFGSHVLIRPRPSRLQRIKPTASAPWVAQQHLTGNEICAYAVAHDGHLVALAAYRALVKAGPGAAVCFAPADTGIVRPFVARFVEATGWTGQISFDLIETPAGQLLPVECNPRATSGLHFFTDSGAFARALISNGSDVAPGTDHSLAVPLALWLYGLPMVARRAQRSAILDAIRQSGDVMDWPGDSIGLAPQLRSVAEFAALALRRRISLTHASTCGIEWNGADQRSIS